MARAAASVPDAMLFSTKALRSSEALSMRVSVGCSVLWFRPVVHQHLLLSYSPTAPHARKD
eukprot:5487419-Pleurochrysis_carterae.AAC.1